jgi:formate dehydrogenase major subunit
MPSMKNITWDRVERESSVTYPCDGADQPGNEIIFASGFPTASGRGKVVPTRIVPPDELPDAAYPMVLSTGRVLEHWHTGAMTRRATTLDAIEPEAIAMMAPRDIESRGFKPGQMIRVETRRGAIDIKLRADQDVPTGMVFIPFCYAEAAANLLTNPALDPFGKIPEFKFCAAKVDPAPARAAAE